MKHLRILTLVIGLALLPSSAFLVSSCKTTPTGIPTATLAPQESVVVAAEKTLRVSKDTFDLFLKIEFDNKDLIKRDAPKIHEYAEYVRRNAPKWLASANQLKNDYKHGNGDLYALYSALNVLRDNANQAQAYINQLNKP